MRQHAVASVALSAVVALASPPSFAGASAIAGKAVFVPLPPCRIVRTIVTPAGAIAAGDTRSFEVLGAATDYSGQGGEAAGCDLPGLGEVLAIFANVVAQNPDGPGNLKAWAGDGVEPVASVLNYQKLTPNLNIANGLALPVRTTGSSGPGVDLNVKASFSAVQVIIDVVGYFAPLSSVSGGGSGLDADLLDGKHASDFADVLHDHSGQSWTGSGFRVLQVTNTGNGGFQSFGLRGINEEVAGAGVFGEATTTGANTAVGVEGRSAAQLGRGVLGVASHASGINAGVHGETFSTGGIALSGLATAATGTTLGLKAKSSSGTGFGGFFVAPTTGTLIAAGNTDSIASLRFKVDGNGNVFSDGAYNCGASVNDGAADLNEAEIEPCLKDDSPADFAEMLPAAAGIEPGDVLAVDAAGSLVRSGTPYQTSVVGIHSTRPSYLGNSRHAGAAGYAPLAIVGIVPVKASAENGAIAPGDLLVASGTPGHAMRAGDAPPQGSVLGKALGALPEASGTVLMLVTLQ